MNEITKRTATALAKSEDSTTKSAGAAMVKTGAVGGGLYFAASLLPFVTFPALLIVLIVLGAYMYIK